MFEGERTKKARGEADARRPAYNMLVTQPAKVGEVAIGQQVHRAEYKLSATDLSPNAPGDGCYAYSRRTGVYEEAGEGRHCRRGMFIKPRRSTNEGVR